MGAAGAKRPAAVGPAGAPRPKAAHLPLGLAGLAPMPPPPRQRRITEEEDDSEGGGSPSSGDGPGVSWLCSQRTESLSEGLDAYDEAEDAASEAAVAAPMRAPRALQSPVVAPNGGRRFVSYCVQRISGGRANHAAFWLQDDAGGSLVAVVVSAACVGQAAEVQCHWLLCFGVLRRPPTHSIPALTCRARMRACPATSPTPPPRRRETLASCCAAPGSPGPLPTHAHALPPPPLIHPTPVHGAGPGARASLHQPRPGGGLAGGVGHDRSGGGGRCQVRADRHLGLVGWACWHAARAAVSASLARLPPPANRQLHARLHPTPPPVLTALPAGCPSCRRRSGGACSTLRRQCGRAPRRCRAAPGPASGVGAGAVVAGVQWRGRCSGLDSAELDTPRDHMQACG